MNNSERKELYMTCADNMRRHFDSMHEKLAFRANTKSEWQIWRRDLVKKLEDLTGYETMQTRSLKPKVTERVGREGYIRDIFRFKLNQASQCPCMS